MAEPEWTKVKSILKQRSVKDYRHSVDQLLYRLIVLIVGI